MRKIGRPTKYTEDMPERVLNYIERRKKENKLPTLEGLALELWVCRDTIHEWRKDPEKEAFSDATLRIDLEQKDMLMNNALDRTWDSGMSRFVLQAKHDFIPKTKEDSESKEEGVSAKDVLDLMNKFHSMKSSDAE